MSSRGKSRLRISGLVSLSFALVAMIVLISSNAGAVLGEATMAQYGEYPVINSISPADGSTLGDNTPAIGLTYSASETITDVQIAIDGSPCTSVVFTDTDASCSPPALAEGFHSVSATVCSAGEYCIAQSWSFVVDTINGSISGTVTDDAGQPLEGIRVYAMTGYWGQWGEAYTDSSGNYTVTGLPGGNYKVEFYADGIHLGEYYSDKPDYGTADPVPVTLGTTTTGIDAALATGGSISGTVTDDAGQPLEGVRVYAMTGYWGQWGEAYTDAGGNYTITGLPGGNYVVEFYSDGIHLGEYYNDSDYYSASIVPVIAASTTSGIDAALAMGGSISGTVTDDAGQPLEGITVSVATGQCCQSFQAYTDASGSYTVSGLPGGDYKVQFYSDGIHIGEYFNDKADSSSADTVPVSPGSTSTGVDAVLETGGSISGTVTGDAGQPLVSAWVVAQHQDAAGNWTSSGDYTDDNGNYEIELLHAGDYTVWFGGTGAYPGEYYDNKSSYDSADPVTVTPGGSATGIDAQLTTGGTISGRVTDEAGQPIPNFKVTIYGPSWWTYCVTNANGNYSINGLAPGDYRVGFDTYYKNSGNYIAEFYSNKDSYSSADLISITSGGIASGIDAVLAEAGSISGTVTDGSGQPVEGVRVVASRLGGEGYDLSWEATTDANGNYTILHLASGAHKVGFFPSDNFQNEFYDDVHLNYWGYGQDVAVTAGSETPDIDAVLEPAGLITGMVTDDNGEPLAGVSVDIYRFNGIYWESFRWVQTDASGNYSVGSLENGNYRLRFNPQGNYVDEYYNDKADVNSADSVPVAVGNTTSGIDAILSAAGSVSGTVTNEDGQAQQNIIITIYKRNSYGSWDSLESFWTDSSGHYSASGLAPGDYKVGFNTAFQYVSGYLPEYYDNKQDINSADLVSVTAGNDTSGIDAVLSTGGSISGTVTNEAGQPLQSKNVTIYRLDNSYGYENWYSAGSAFTDINGNYSVGGLQTGSYKVGFITNFAEPTPYLPEYYNDKPDLNSADLVAVTAGSGTTGIDAALAVGGSISGTVTDEAGQPIGGVAVTKYKLSSYGWWDYAGYTYTDANGNYVLTGLAGGDVKIGFDSDNHITEYYNDKPDLNSADLLSVTAGGDISGIDASLAAAGSINGTVTDEAGQPLPSTYVYIYQDNNNDGWWDYAGSASVDASGNYWVGGLASGQYKVSFQPSSYCDFSGCHDSSYLSEFYSDKPDVTTADWVNVVAGSPTSGIDAVLSMGGSISGLVTDEAGQPLPTANVVAYKFDPAEGSWDYYMSANTDAAGNYSITRLPTGHYKVSFGPSYNCGNNGCSYANYLDEYYDDAPDLNTAELVPVTQGQDTSGIDASLAAGARISGTVTNTEGQPLPNAYIAIYDSHGGNAGGTYADASGHYSINGLASGDYRLEFRSEICIYGQCLNYLPEFYSDKADLESADSVSASTGSETAGVDFVLSAGGSIDGAVTNESGEPLQGIAVELYEYSSGSWNGASVGQDAYPGGDGGTWKMVARVVSNNLGEYSIGGLRDRDYRVGFSDAANVYLSEFYDDKADINSADPVSVAAGQATSGVNAVLSEGQSHGQIAGTVTDGSGQPLLTASVIIYRLTDSATGLWSQVGSVYTDSAGAYLAGGLPEGDYKVGFGYFTSANLAPEFYNDKPDLQAAELVHVTSGSVTSGIDASLGTGGSISGNVTNDAGQPLIYQYVYLCQRDGSGEWKIVRSVSTDASGHYEIDGLASGQYKVGFNLVFSSVYRSEYYNDMPDEQSAEIVTVTAGNETAGIDASLTAEDAQAPDIAITSPSGTVNHDSVEINADYGDGSGTGIQMASVMVRLDGNDVTAGCDVGISSVKCPVAGLAQGEHQISVSAADLVGNVAATSGSFSVDSVAPVIADLAASASCSGATVTWETDEAATTELAWSWSGGTGSSVDETLSTVHSATIAGIPSGEAVSYAVTSTDGAGNAAVGEEKSFLTLTGSRPLLALSSTKVYWASYVDYLDSELSIDYRLRNVGTSDAFAATVTDSSATNSVTLSSGLSLLVGDISQGAAADYTLMYSVPGGVARFLVRNEVSAQDACGYTHEYP